MKELESVVVRFSGDSGDGMQLTGTQFSDTTAQMGNDLATFPDYPSEIRAPQGTIAGVSGFQVQFGATEISTPGDDPDVLVAMNPAALKANLPCLKKSGMIIVNSSSFDERGLQKAGYNENPLTSGELNGYQVIPAALKELVLESLKDLELDNKAKIRCKNFYALGITYFLFNRELAPTKEWIKAKFKNNPSVVAANLAALDGGYHFADKGHLAVSTFKVPVAKIEPGTYRQINGNVGTAWGLMQGAESAGLKLFLGSYPITPATDILHELSKYKEFGVKTYQAEDEIAGICSAIGAGFGGAMACTTTSGPGLALKGEAIGLAMIYELPLVIVNVQR
ncbi:MAG: 2-oxoacid:acceptor oxidoreductase family protein, partial [Bacteriovoracaceae bacterium]|nr:2-oxoacid:acceptor oxidoreductase family protein [Bacteriovoracaceae bacterium]